MLSTVHNQLDKKTLLDDKVKDILLGVITDYNGNVLLNTFDSVKDSAKHLSAVKQLSGTNVYTFLNNSVAEAA